MTILALDTTSRLASVAIRSGGVTVAETAFESAAGFADLIFQEIEKLRFKANLPIELIDCFAAASGPGSFTGVRVGLTAIKGLSFATGKPAYAISNLKLLASFGKSAWRAVALDARRLEIYGAVYDSALRTVESETVMPPAKWVASLDPGCRYEFLSSPHSPLRASLEGTLFEGMPYREVTGGLASAVAECAERERGEWLDPALLDANYVRRSDAERCWADQAF